MGMGRALALAAALLLCGGTAGFDAHKMKKCADNAFCKRHRGYADAPGASPEARGGAYVATAASLELDGAGARLLVESARHKVPLELTISALPGGMTARVRLREAEPLHPRFEAPYVLVESGTTTAPLALLVKDTDGVTFALGGKDVGQVRVDFSPLRVRFFAPAVSPGTEPVEVVTLNARGLLEYEHYRKRPPPTAAAAEKVDEEGTEEGGEQAKPEGEADTDEELVWEESFQSHKDTRPRGPSSIGLDLELPGFSHVFGLPERATSFNLKNTRPSAQPASHEPYAEPYRLYNLDVFEYVTDSPFGLYGAVPLLIAHSAQRSAAVFWSNPSEMYVDVLRAPRDPVGALGGGDDTTTQTHWIVESGIVDLFVLLGPTPRAITRQFTSLTGTPFLPAVWSLGYHQCRWNYNDEADVKDIDSHFEELDFPFDVLWLDIEHTDGKRYFTWDARKFSAPAKMTEALAERGHKLVVIIDPHIKVDNNYPVYSEAKRLGYFVRTHSNETFEGWCWPGTSSYLDFLQPEVRTYWADRLQLANYSGSTHHTHVWNDMNEPSVFNGPEVTMQKDSLHALGSVEHRDVHNMYGHLQTIATMNGLLQRENLGPAGSQRGRAFILTRSFFAGTQRTAAVWTGDNMGKWDHLGASVPMLLTLSLSGITFCGADVGGFFFNPEVELLERWYQAGAYQPFFRAHAHIETKRREPWLFGEPHLSRMRESVRERYRILPYIYTLFAEAALDGTPVMRPLWFEFPGDGGTLGEEASFLLGPALLVRVVAEAGITSVAVRLPGPESLPWYDAHTLALAGHGGATPTLAAPAERIPVLQRGGTIIPRRERLRRASSQMALDPYTLVVAPDALGEATGELYVDDGTSHGYEDKEFGWRALRLSGGRLACTAHAGRPAGAPDAAAKVRALGAFVERVVLLGVRSPPVRVTVVLGGGAAIELGFTHDVAAQVLVVRKPGVPINGDWVLTVH